MGTTISDPRHSLEHGLIFGSPETVCEKVAELEKMGLGGLIIHFRLGSMSYEDNAHSLKLFAEKVIPEFKSASTV